MCKWGKSHTHSTEPCFSPFSTKSLDGDTLYFYLSGLVLLSYGTHDTFVFNLIKNERIFVHFKHENLLFVQELLPMRFPVIPAPHGPLYCISAAQMNIANTWAKMFKYQHSLFISIILIWNKCFDTRCRHQPGFSTALYLNGRGNCPQWNVSFHFWTC